MVHIFFAPDELIRITYEYVIQHRVIALLIVVIALGIWIIYEIKTAPTMRNDYDIRRDMERKEPMSKDLEDGN